MPLLTILSLKVRAADEVDNLQWVYMPINNMKNFLSEEDFFKLIAEVANYRNL